MKVKLARTLSKVIMTVVAHAAFFFLLTNVNVTCCGPGHQPKLPESMNGYRRYGHDE